MKGIAKRLIIISFILSLIATSAVYFYLSSLKGKSKKEEYVKILAASASIQKGTIIQKNMIKEVEIAKESFLEGYIKDYALVVGKYAKENIVKDEIFVKEKLQNDNINELSFQIRQNYRAVSLNVTGDTGISYLLKPGDYVDVIVYLSEKKDSGKVIRPDVAKMVLQNLKVLAVDRNLTRENNTKDDGKVPTNFFVTVEVLASDAEKLVLAGDIGVVKLALRPVNDNTIINTSGAVDENLLKNSSSKINTKYTYYKVKKGDTLKNISTKFYGTPDNYTLLKEVNNIKNENFIVPGLILKIPLI